MIPPRPDNRSRKSFMEFLNLCLMFVTAWLVWKRPQKETIARRLLLASVVLMVLLFMVGTRTSLLPGLNY